MVDYNPFNRSDVDNCYAIYRQLRDEAPVYHNEELDFYAISRYDDVSQAHLNAEVLSSAHGNTIEGIEAGTPLLVIKDPPEHTWHRKIVARLFTPRRIAQLEPFIRTTTQALLDACRDRDSFDVIEEFSIKLPLDVISELVGLPVELRAQIHELSDVVALREENSAEAPEAAFQALATMREILTEVIVERRRRPGDDVISMLIQTEVVDDAGQAHHLGDDELASRFVELAFAGHETVAKLIPNGIIAMAWYPDQRTELVKDHSLIPHAVEETLRWDPPSQYQGRWTLKPYELRGHTIPSGRRVILLTGSAVHDERQFVEPELFDIHRKIEKHVSFGVGRHLCLGAAVARLETRIAFEEFLSRFPEFEIDPSGVERQYSGNVRGLSKLRIVVA